MLCLPQYDVWQLKHIPICGETLAAETQHLHGLGFVEADSFPGGELYAYFHYHLEKDVSRRDQEINITASGSEHADDWGDIINDMDSDYANGKNRCNMNAASSHVGTANLKKKVKKSKDLS